jgi:serine/threonine protein kinase
MDTTSANIGLSRQDFLLNLAASKLVADSEIERLAATDADALGIAHSLLSSGALTDYQFEAISQGRQAELRVGNYDILSRLGAGGMGTVFKARHRRMKRVVALKVLSAALSTDTAFVLRFQREVETIARLSHPNVVMAYDADEAEIGHFLVMEFVDGPDLASLVEKDRAFDVPRAVDCVLQSARGLAYAHAQGIIHRDVKPHNLLRDPGGTVKVTDLGLARLSQVGGAASSLTQAGGIVGTPDYMPPEQAFDSASTDHRADIYSLGCTLYFLLTGGPPYSGKSIMAILLKHREGAIPSLVKVRADVPPELDRVFQRMVAKSVTDRYQTMAEVVAAFEAIAVQVGLQPTSAAQRPPAPAQTSSGSSIAVGKPTEGTFVGSPEAARATTVLIVEPSRVQAGIIRKYLESQEIVVSVAATGAQALDAVRANLPDGIVAALHLDDITGIELAQQIRTEFPHPAPGFVLISSEAEADDSGSLSKLNRVVTLRKPFTPEQLVQSLRVVMGRSQSGVAQPRPDRSRYRVLIVDDFATARLHERSVLKSLGFSQFVEAADGAQAIAAAAREPFDLIVTDYNMPLMDGHALVSYLKQTPATASIPVVMVTTETDDNVLGPIRALGVIAIFGKAFAPDVVGPVLDKLF